MSQHPAELAPRLRRRTILQIMAAGGAAAALPWFPSCGDSSKAAKEPARFFTSSERETIEALAEAIVPEDQTVGAVGAGAVEYIDRYLAAFDDAEPTVYRSGPFSGRQPYPDPETGGPSGKFPPDDFENVLPLTRLQELSFRIELYGSDSVPNGNINSPVIEPTPGLRALYRQGAASLEAFATAQGAARFADLDSEQRLAAMATLPGDLQKALINHLAEGMFCAPEYGGNTGGVAWRDYQYSGDSQPLGYTFYDAQSDTLRDNPDRPNQTRDPSWPGDGLEPNVESFIGAVAVGSGGKRFF